MMLAIDPGITTGLAFTSEGTRYVTSVEHEANGLYDFIMTGAWHQVIVEQFVTSNIHSHRYGIRTTELVGGVEAVCYTHSIPCVRRSPQQRIPYEHRAQEILRAQGRKPSSMYSNDKFYLDHEVSALSHLLSWQAKLARESND